LATPHFGNVQEWTAERRRRRGVATRWRSRALDLREGATPWPVPKAKRGHPPGVDVAEVKLFGRRRFVAKLTLQ